MGAPHLSGVGDVWDGNASEGGQSEGDAGGGGWSEQEVDGGACLLLFLLPQLLWLSLLSQLLLSLHLDRLCLRQVGGAEG